MTVLLSAKDLCLMRGDRILFEGLGFALDYGELLLVEGPNGSGKTSLLKAAAGLIEFDEGSLAWRGRNTRRCRQEYRASVAWFAHRPGFKGDLTPLENLRFEAGLRVPAATDFSAALERAGAVGTAHLPMRVLSAGQQRRVGLARMILSRARLWMLDEPFTNLDTQGQALVRKLLSEHLDDGGIAIVASHQHVDIDQPTHRIHLQ